MTRRIPCTLSLAAIILLVTIPARAQEELPAISAREIFAKNYPEVFTVFDKWNAREIEWNKEAFSSLFGTEVKRLSVGKPGGWAEERSRVWSQLPQRLESRLRINETAQVMVGCYFSQNAKQFRRAEITQEQRAELINCKLYLILALAQDKATERKSDQIEPSDMFVGFAAAWTSLWPFCPGPDK